MLHAEEGMIRMACSYPDMSRSQRHEFLEDVKAGLEALGRPREEGGFEEVKAKGGEFEDQHLPRAWQGKRSHLTRHGMPPHHPQEFQDGGKSKGGTKPPLGGAWEEPRREQAISQVPQRTHLIPQEIPQQVSLSSSCPSYAFHFACCLLDGLPTYRPSSLFLPPMGPHLP